MPSWNVCSPIPPGTWNPAVPDPGILAATGMDALKAPLVRTLIRCYRATTSLPVCTPAPETILRKYTPGARALPD
jgi:hypothetical protein